MIVAPRRQILAAVAAIALSMALITLIGVVWGPAGERVMTVFFISLIGVVGIGVYSGNSGILSFGHLAFMGVGAYASALLTVPAMMKKTTLPNLPDWLAATELGLPEAILVAMLVAMAVALVAGLAIGRLEGSSAVIATLGLLIIVHGVLIGWRDVTRGAQSFFGVPRATDVYTAAICCALALVAARLYRDSVSGLRLRAARENAIAAQAVGVRIKRERMIAWLLSAALMALSGALLAHFLGAFSPKKFYFHDTFLLLAMLIVGGMSTVSGAVAGAVIITIVTEVLRRLEGGVDLGGLELPAFFGATQIGIGLIILLAMFRKSEGVLGFKEWEERPGLGLGAATPTPAPAFAATLAPDGAERAALAGEALTMRFGGLVAVNEVSIKLQPGEILGLIGPNGSGKTTLLNMLSGVLRPSAGSARLGERDLLDARPAQIADYGVARTFQNIRLFGALSVRQNVLTAALSTHGGANAAARAEAAMARLGVAHVAELEAQTLSYGDQRRVEIARALACRPALLFLDEPAAGMNREETDALMAVLRGFAREDGIGVLLVDHDLKLINALCDRIVVLNEGRLIAEGDPAEVRRNPAVIEAYLGRQHKTEHPSDPEMETT